MKLWIMSDLHIEQSAWDLPDERPEHDAIIAAGDIHTASAGVRWLAERAQGKPVIYVSGNHEWYFRVMADEIKAARQLADQEGVHFLWDQEVAIDGVRFLGTPLWTDFELYGEPADSMAYAEFRMNDYKVINSVDKATVLRANDTRRWSLKSRAWLAEKLADQAPKKTVVVTHHLPHPQSIEARYRGSHLSPAYASDLSTMVERSGAMLWVHGHSHANADYMAGSTRVVCNPKGYGPKRPGGTYENPDFDPGLVIEI